ncbi:MAG TPA: hypothetical protein VM925_19135 [Labilithrix sp.]|nr:hypothetical protein [Labilithrix sp.]
MAVDSVGIIALHAFACVLARQAGFDHVSDDDFSRVTIAQAFAHAPKLDPSGTSWLPFPFWILGSAMAVLGRSLDVAHAVSVLFASVAATTPCLALRLGGIPRARALFATAFAFVTPWCIWLGAATVPESFTASFTAAGAIGLAAYCQRDRDSAGFVHPPHEGRAHGTRRLPILIALAITAACLSRYDAWPVAAVLAVCLVVSALQESDRRGLLLGLAAICVLGPLVWIAWNAHAHDGPLHFFRRVARFKQASGEGATDTWSALVLYPGLLFTTRPEVAIPALFLLPALRDSTVRRRWAIPLLCAAAQVAFLAYGNVRDGAPTHHPERALLGALLLLALFVGDVGLTKLAELAQDGRSLTAKGGAAVFALAWIISSVRGADPPGQGPSEDRREQIARGEKLRAIRARSILITPCAFEHFALIAAYGAPENAETKPRSGAFSAECPDVQVR